MVESISFDILKHLRQISNMFSMFPENCGYGSLDSARTVHKALRFNVLDLQHITG